MAREGPGRPTAVRVNDADKRQDNSAEYTHWVTPVLRGVQRRGEEGRGTVSWWYAGPQRVIGTLPSLHAYSALAVAETHA